MNYLWLAFLGCGRLGHIPLGSREQTFWQNFGWLMGVIKYVNGPALWVEKKNGQALGVEKNKEKRN